MASARSADRYFDTSSAAASSSKQPLLHRHHPHNDTDTEDTDTDDENDEDDTLTPPGDDELHNMAGFFASTTGMTRLGMLRAYWLGIV
ncbi:hypothetical protein B0A55_13645, partial [Friedmanniomyces simplex]